jgi:hypothetical protein
MNAHRLTFARRVSLKHCHQVLRCFSAIPLSADEVCFRSNIGCRRFETIPSKPISQALAKTSVEA